jgi:arylsulfatase
MEQGRQACVRIAQAAALLMVLSGCGKSVPVSASAQAAAAAAGRPNVLVIVADDLGYSDLSAFGSEINTPNIDQLAQQGRILTNIHATPLCATSRADLLTGADHHLVGMGTLPESNTFYPDDASYQGSLDQNARTVAQLLHDSGYHTYMAGKWHLAGGGPVNWGFEQSFSMDYAEAFGSNFAPSASVPESAARTYYENGVAATLPADFFSSDYYEQRLESYIGSNHGDGQPFFAYLAFQAVHFPLQVPQAYLNLYSGKYAAGYDAIRNARMQKQKALGIVPQDLVPNPGDEVTMVRFGQPGPLTNQAWDTLTPDQQQSEARIMEVFAGMLTNMDDNVGKLITYLKQMGEYDNTLIIFVSDNGADGMGYGFIPYVDGAGNTDINNAYANYGLPGSFLFRSTRWAEVGTAPFRLFKSFTAEGGISVPAIVRLPGQSSGLPQSPVLASLLDVAPTILDAAGLPLPGDQYQGHSVAPLEGRSLMPVLTGQADQIYDDTDVVVDEVDDIRYVRRGPWKLTRVVNYMLPSAALLIDHDWQLYNMDTDRGETNDVSAENPAIVSELIADWDAYVSRVGVAQPILPPLLPPITQ